MHFPASSALGALSADGQFFNPAIVCAAGAVLEIVGRSDAVSIRERALLSTRDNGNGLAVLPFDAPWLRSAVAIIWRRDRLPHPASKAFCEAARRSEADAMREDASIQACIRDQSSP